MAVVALFAAVLIAASSPSGGGFAALFGTYCYWLIRIMMQSLMFISARSIIERYAPGSFSKSKVLVLSILLSHLPFVLAVTAMDIILGYPELGIGGAGSGTTLRVFEFGLELVFLFDNHVALCLLLSVPGWVLRASTSGASPVDESKKGTFLSTIDPPLSGVILWVEAQEHYVRITTQHESRLVLARFSDIVRDLSTKDGLQVHRSHWVAKSAIVNEQKSGQNLILVLSTGDTVPVSRSFRRKLVAATEAQ
ncbi:hypothetical protein C1J03_17570 [Sulfitobacter sp. SK012]|nr:hypothetical protein C1J03_17570 [Sulfitobacter sp. SK012]